MNEKIFFENTTYKKGVNMKRFLLFSVISAVILSTFCGIMPTTVFAATAEEVSSKSAVLMDYGSKEILLEKNAHDKVPVASMVKMMTILLTLEEIDAGNLQLSEMLTTSEKAAGMGGSQVFIDPFVEYSVSDMLKSVIVASANDASVALSEHIAGSEEAFVKRMNKRAKELGMNDTNYVNCTGLPAPEQYSSAYDSALVLHEVTGHEIYHNYSTIWMEDLVHPSGRKTGLVNTNRLIRYYNGCDGGKTGSTNEAGCCLAATAKRDDMRLISVIVGAKDSKTRFNECSSLFNYGFANFENVSLVNSAEALKVLPVSKGRVKEVEIYAAEDFSALIKKGEENGYEVQIDVPASVKAPVKAGQSVGKVMVLKEGVVVKEIPLVTKSDLKKMTYLDSLKKIGEKW